MLVYVVNLLHVLKLIEWVGVWFLISHVFLLDHFIVIKVEFFLSHLCFWRRQIWTFLRLLVKSCRWPSLCGKLFRLLFSQIKAWLFTRLKSLPRLIPMSFWRVKLRYLWARISRSVHFVFITICLLVVIYKAGVKVLFRRWFLCQFAYIFNIISSTKRTIPWNLIHLNFHLLWRRKLLGLTHRRWIGRVHSWLLTSCRKPIVLDVTLI